jgi:hypothetical protein
MIRHKSTAFFPLAGESENSGISVMRELVILVVVVLLLIPAAWFIQGHVTVSASGLPLEVKTKTCTCVGAMVLISDKPVLHCINCGRTGPIDDPQ